MELAGDVQVSCPAQNQNKRGQLSPVPLLSAVRRDQPDAGPVALTGAKPRPHCAPCPYGAFRRQCGRTAGTEGS